MGWVGPVRLGVRGSIGEGWGAGRVTPGHMPVLLAEEQGSSGAEHGTSHMLGQRGYRK